MRVCVISTDLEELAWVGGYARRVTAGLTVLVLHLGLDIHAAADVMREVLTGDELRAVVVAHAAEVSSQIA